MKKIILLISFIPLFVFAGRSWSDPKLLEWLQSAETQKEIEKNTSESIEGEVLAGADAAPDEVIDPEPSEFKGGPGAPWLPPIYANQEKALGWSPDVFSVPEGMRERVDFWKSVYAQYTTNEGVLHDSLHVGIVYTHIDFRPIMADRKLSEVQKRKKRRELVESKKKEARERIARIENGKTQDAEDERLAKLFAKHNETNIFKNAVGKRRLRFQLGQKDRFQQGIYYSGRYLEQMEQIFAEAGLPKEITRLPFVESSFNVNARSRVGASGVWQFMRYTGRRFMRINYAVDERNDPIRATRAAARLLRLNYEMLGKWPLAITGYNHGPAGVQRVVKKFGTDSIAELVDERHGRFGFASANFYACFLAALEVEREAGKYFGDVARALPIEAEELKLDRPVNRKNLLIWFDNDVEKAKSMNLHIQRAFWLGHANLSAKDMVWLPKGKLTIAQESLKNMKTVVAAETANHYIIGTGETLSHISQQLGVSIRALMEVNGIENPRRIRAGQKLIVPSK